jgi:hypothetical protein
MEISEIGGENPDQKINNIEDNGRPLNWLLDSKTGWPMCKTCNVLMLTKRPSTTKVYCCYCPSCTVEQSFPSCRSSHRYCAWEIANPVRIDE